MPVILYGCGKTEENRAPTEIENKVEAEVEIIEKVARKPLAEPTSLSSTKTVEEEVVLAPAAYVGYTPELFAELKGLAPVAIFFHSSSCAPCTELDASINMNLASLPKGATILKADFDVETQLRKEYAIFTQPTVAVFDRGGLLIEKLYVPSFAEIKTALIAAGE